MSVTGLLTYWLVVGLYQSFHFYQAAMERQTRAAQLETQLSQAELENLKSQLHPHFLFNSLHTIGVLMREDVDAAGHLLVILGDLLRMALERRDNEITLESELEFVSKYLEIEQTRFHDRLKVFVDVPPDLLEVYVPSLALQPLVENAIKHGISVDSTAGRLELAAKRRNGRVCLRVRDDGPGPAPGSRLRFGVGLNNVQSRLKQLYGDESSLDALTLFRDRCGRWFLIDLAARPAVGPRQHRRIEFSEFNDEIRRVRAGGCDEGEFPET